MRQLLGSERGIAVPTTLLVLIVALGFSTVAIVASTASQRGSVRDQDRKEGIASADAGVDEAILRQNKIPTTAGQPCVVPVVFGAVTQLAAGSPEADGWCPAQSGTVGGTSYAYRTSPRIVVPPQSNPTGQETLQMSVASTGTSDAVSRRVLARASAPSGVDIFGIDRAVGVDGVTIGGTATVSAPTGTNGQLTVENNGTLCEDGRYGPGHGVVFENLGSQCTGYGQVEGSVPFPPPDLTAVRQSNDNGRFFSLDTKTGNATWDPVTRTLNMGGSASVTMGGSDYLFCRLDMSGSSRLIMARGSHVRIYFDSPENCGMSDPAEQVKVIGTSAIVSTAYDPASGNFDLPGLYMLGSDEIRSTAYFDGTANVLNEFVLYAPRTDVTITGTAEYIGAVAGQTLQVDGTALLTSDANMPNPDVNTIIVYKRDRYVECTGTAQSSPGESC